MNLLCLLTFSPFCAPTCAIPAPINPAPNTVNLSTFPDEVDGVLDKCRWTVARRDAALILTGDDIVRADEIAEPVRRGSIAI